MIHSGAVHRRPSWTAQRKTAQGENAQHGTGRRWTAWAWTALLCLAAAGCSSTPSSVDRVHDGKSWRGRYIHSFSYAWYARGAHLEARGLLREAEAAYLEAVSHDPDSGSLWARVGAVRCLRGAAGAGRAFEAGWSTGNDRSLLLVERGRCALRSKDFEAALQDGRAAVRRSPRSIEASLLTIDALLGLDRSEEAMRWLDALAAFAPGALQVHTRRIEEARSRRDVARERRARELRLALVSHQTLERPAVDPEVEVRGPAAIDAAIRAGDLELASRRATMLGMRSAEVALRALALGRPDLARTQAELVLAADPGESNGRIALWLADDLVSGNTQAQTWTVPTAGQLRPGSSPGDLHPLAVLLFGELLDRRVGSLAGDLWREAHPVATSTDYLVERVRARHHARTAKTADTPLSSPRQPKEHQP